MRGQKKDRRPRQRTTRHDMTDPALTFLRLSLTSCSVLSFLLGDCNCLCKLNLARRNSACLSMHACDAGEGGN